MSKFENYLKRFDIAANVTDEELEKTQALLQLYGPTLRRSSRRLEEFEEECYESRRQSVSDFIIWLLIMIGIPTASGLLSA